MSKSLFEGVEPAPLGKVRDLRQRLGLRGGEGSGQETRARVQRLARVPEAEQGRT